MLEAVPIFNHWILSSLWWAACGSGFVKSGQLTVIISCLLFFTQWWITFKFSFHLFTFRTETFNDFLFTLLNPLVWLLKILHSGFVHSCHFLLNSFYFLMLIPSTQTSFFLPFSTSKVCMFLFPFLEKHSLSMPRIFSLSSQAHLPILYVTFLQEAFHSSPY